MPGGLSLLRPAIARVLNLAGSREVRNGGLRMAWGAFTA